MSDFTFYPQRSDVLRELGWLGLLDTEIKAVPALDVGFSFRGKRSEKMQRAIVCSCYGGRRCAVTARETDQNVKQMRGPRIEIDRPKLSNYTSRSALSKWPNDDSNPLATKRRKENQAFVAKIWMEILRVRSLQGIIVIAGETGSRKTTVAREIARRHVGRLLEAGRERPHIVTYEDPIESCFANSPEQASQSGFEYTPRQRNIDVGDLDSAVVDALRQKPALFYVNEVRSMKDWSSLLYFAGTGHLAITTTHAGSLVETFERIIVAAGAETSARRSEVASRIVAVVHLKKLRSKLVPVLWVQTARSRTALTQEGLGSLLPTRDGGCYGRADFAEKLKLRRNLFRAAVKSDLLGG